ncbi:type III PLP-dependent enzyme [Roseitranquillus sediminis]|uniref:type III PLP-dependent enzyme n=1 Tax=Roseitranquillus sediminis TaxID=2809051 RepID=UPI001D0C6A07|nr:type III PLP-dependent enzyme [Roseitranquillus sediminis]MBM9595299.1 type III PLP-dependent enzyme [Roseitranquillus sediminis]
MGLDNTFWAKPADYVRALEPEEPVLFFSPAILQATARRFLEGFPGLVTYAVKSNPDAVVIQNLDAAGIRGYDVASIYEIELIRTVAPGAAMHYNNPVRSRNEIARAVELGVRSFSVDSGSELAKLGGLVPAGAEISVRFKLPVKGAAYDFGAKFGTTAEHAAILLAEVEQMGFVPSLTFHPGTQCTDPQAWDAYIRTAARIAQDAGVRLARLNVGGGFPAHRVRGDMPRLDDIFRLIDRVTGEAFGTERPDLVCEPGRGMVAEAFSLATQVRAIRDDAHVFLNDGVYGGLAELPLIGLIDRVDVRDSEGRARSGAARDRIVFGPTCDSVDRLPGTLPLPADMEEGDYVVFHGMGAYSTATVTRFNGFGVLRMATVLSLTD